MNINGKIVVVFLLKTNAITYNILTNGHNKIMLY